MAAPLVELLGPKLMGKDAECSTADALAGKGAVALYFSAHWCPPCRGFTPKLAEWYTKDLKAKGLEVVFVSSDRDEQSFKDYYGEQPWLALPYGARDIKDKLSKKYKVQGIPSLVILDGATGATITTEGREAVAGDPTGKEFPWTPPTFWDALGTEFLQGTDGDTVEVDELKGKGKYIGLYFSAHWCPPCRGFTPDLIKAYTDHLKAKNLEIIFVSSDRSQQEFLEYFGTMPWLAIPQGDKRKGVLSQMFGVQGIPSFVVVDAETGATVNGAARGKVSSDPKGEEFPWPPKPLNDLDEDGPEGINDELALVALMEGCSVELKAAAKEQLMACAKQAKDKGEEALYFTASKAGGDIAGKVRQLTKVGTPDDKPKLVLLDIPNDGAYYVSPATEITHDTVTSFMEMYKAGALERQQLG